MAKITPLLSWVGGKRKIMKKLIENIPETFNDYYEPFLGGSSVFLNIPFEKQAFVNDYNYDLYNFYQQIKDKPEQVIEWLKIYKQDYIDIVEMNDRREYFLSKRENYWNSTDDSEKAALYFFLNKTSFNGIMNYRVDGRIGCSFGKHKASRMKQLNEENLLNFSKSLNRSNMTNQDYEVFLSSAKEGDFVYLDPPYVSEDNSKFSYKYIAKEKGWQKEEHLRLFRVIEELHERGCFILLSNSYSSLVREYFSDKQEYNMEILGVSRCLTAAGPYRAMKQEVLIKNYLKN